MPPRTQDYTPEPIPDLPADLMLDVAQRPAIDAEVLRERKLKTFNRPIPTAPAPQAPASAPQAAAPAPAPEATRGRLRIGFITPRVIRFVFLAIIYGLAFSMFGATIIGTHYGALFTPAPNWRDIWVVLTSIPLVYFPALAGQVILTGLQWGSLDAARRERDPRWLVLYLLSLVISTYFNIEAYADALVAAGVPILLAMLSLLLFDVILELALVAHDRKGAS